jgi:hypothetical protein
MSGNPKQVNYSKAIIYKKNIFQSLCGCETLKYSCFARIRGQALRLVMLFFLSSLISFSGNAQNFEISANVCDSISPTNYSMHVSGYATFTDSMTMTIELLTADSTGAIVYSGSKDFGTNGTNTLTNFLYNSSDESFSLDLGSYTNDGYTIRVRSWINGEIEEELKIDTY